MPAEDSLPMLAELRVQNGPAADLALLVAAAARIEQPLLRRMRLAFLPASDPSAESDLWFSPLVRIRNALEITLRDEVLLELRQKLAKHPDRLAIREELRTAHAALPKLLLLEEELIWLGLIGAPEHEINAQLAQVLRTMSLHPSRAEDLSAWAARVLPSVPPEVRRSTGAWLLRNAAQTRLKVKVPLDGQPPPELADVSLESLLPPPSTDLAVSVRRVDNLIEIAPAAPQSSGISLHLPATDPLFVLVEAGDGQRILHEVPPGEPYRFTVSAADVRLQSLRGDRWILNRRPAPSDGQTASAPPRFLDRWVLVAGSAEREALPNEQAWAAAALGATLARGGYGLLTGGFVGVDHAVTEHFLRTLAQTPESREAIADERLLHVVSGNRTPSYPYGRLVHAASLDEEYWEGVRRAQAVVLIGGGDGTYTVGQHARRAGCWVFSFPGTRGVASLFHADNRDQPDKSILKDPAQAEQFAHAIMEVLGVRLQPQEGGSGWPPRELVELALDHLSPGRRSSGELPVQLEHAVAEVDLSPGEVRQGMESRIAAERLVAYCAVKQRLLGEMLAALCVAATKEARWATSFSEMRPLAAALSAMGPLIKLMPDAEVSNLVRRSLKEILTVLQEFQPIDLAGYCTELVKSLQRQLAKSAPTVKEQLRTSAAQASEPIAAGTDFLLLASSNEVMDVLVSRLSNLKSLAPPRNSMLAAYQAEVAVRGPAHEGASYRVIIASPRTSGSSEAAISILDAMTQWQPRYALMLGSAIGDASRVAQGDVVVAEEFIDYYGSSRIFTADAELLAAGRRLRGWEREMSQQPADAIPRVHIGQVIGSNRVLKGSDGFQSYKKEWRQLLAVVPEMSSVAPTVWQGRGRPLMVYAVTELTEGKTSSRSRQRRSYALDAAAAYTISLLKSGPVPPVSSQPTAQSPDTVEPPARGQTATGVACFYDPTDRSAFEQLREHLAPMLHTGSITLWDPGRVNVGADRSAALEAAAAKADVNLLLVSSDFLRTAQEEPWFEIVEERLHRGQAPLVPIMVRPALVADSTLSSVQSVPRNGRAISQWKNRDEAWVEVTSELNTLIKLRNERERGGATPAAPSQRNYFPARLVDALRGGRLVPIVGAGVSHAVLRAGGTAPLFPTWSELLMHAAERVEEAGNGGTAREIRALSQRGNAEAMLEALEAARAVLKGGGWSQLLTNLLAPAESQADSNSLRLPRALWQLGSNLLVTTNYDRVLEWACQGELGRESRIANISAPALLTDILSGSALLPTVWHLYGAITDMSGMILTQDGYHRLYPERGNGEAEYQAALLSLRRLMSSHTLLFVGFSSAREPFVADIQWLEELFQGATGPHYLLERVDRLDGLRHQLARLPLELVSLDDHNEAFLQTIRQLAATRNAR